MALLCLHCGAETDLAENERLSACPSCGDSKYVPADLDDTVNLTITRHELRILTMWASNWGSDHARLDDGESQRVVQRICDRIGMQTDTPLTLSQEIADLRAHFGSGNVEVLRDDGSEIGP